MVVEFMFTNTVYDICWSPDGSTAFACSGDGTVAAFRFDPTSFGTPVSQGQRESLMSKYGFHRKNRDKLLAEFPSQLELEERYRIKTHVANTSTTAPTILPVATTAATSTATTTIASSNNNSNRLMSLMHGESTFTVSGALIPKSTDPQATLPNLAVSSSQAPVAGPPGPVLPPFSQAPSIPYSPTTRDTQQVTIGQDGKRRIQPILLHSPSNAADQQQRITMTKDGRKRVQPIFVHSPSTNVDQANGGVTASSTKRIADAEMRQDLIIKKRILDLVSNKESLRIDDRIVKLPVPKMSSSLVVHVDSGTILSVENPSESFRSPWISHLIAGANAAATLAKVACKKNGELLWCDYLSKPALRIAHAQDLVVVTTTDNCMYTFHLQTGRVVLPRLRLDGKASFLHLTADMLGIITELGRVWIWCLRPVPLCVLRGVSVAPLFPDRTKDQQPPPPSAQDESPTPILSLTSFHVTERGVPIVRLSDRSSFAFDRNLQSWLRIAGGDQLDVLADHYDPETVRAQAQAHLDKTGLVGVLGGVGKGGWWNPASVLQQITNPNLNKEMQQQISLSYLEVYFSFG